MSFSFLQNYTRFTDDYKRKILISFFIAFYCLVVLSPLSLNSMFTAAVEYVIHSSVTQQVKLGLFNGIFPARVLEFQKDVINQLPFFQFYYPIIFIISAILDLVFENVYFVLKLTMFIFLLMALRYFYKIPLRYTLSSRISILVGLVYLSAPYILININLRLAFKEVVAQCTKSMFLYYCIILRNID